MNVSTGPAAAAAAGHFVEHFVGIDVAKRKLDVAVLPSRQSFTLANWTRRSPAAAGSSA